MSSSEQRSANETKRQTQDTRVREDGVSAQSRQVSKHKDIADRATDTEAKQRASDLKFIEEGVRLANYTSMGLSELSPEQQAKVMARGEVISELISQYFGPPDPTKDRSAEQARGEHLEEIAVDTRRRRGMIEDYMSYKNKTANVKGGRDTVLLKQMTANAETAEMLNERLIDRCFQSTCDELDARC